VAVPYLPPLSHQLDGSRYAHQNCVPATGTALMDRASMGYWRVAPSTLRTRSGDTSGGMSYEQLAAVVKSSTNSQVLLVPAYRLSEGNLDTLLDSGKAVGVSISCLVTVNTPYHTGTFTGGHTLGVHKKRFNASAGGRKEYLVGDPGTTKDWTWWPASLLIKAAKARSGGTISLVSCRDTEGVGRVARNVGNIRSTPSTGATDKGDTKTGVAYSVLSTVNGGKWTTADGRTAYGWAKIRTGTGVTGYVAGGLLI
jgi:hypothetical protein